MFLTIVVKYLADPKMKSFLLIKKYIYYISEMINPKQGNLSEWDFFHVCL